MEAASIVDSIRRDVRLDSYGKDRANAGSEAIARWSFGSSSCWRLDKRWTNRRGLRDQLRVFGVQDRSGLAAPESHQPVGTVRLLESNAKRPNAGLPYVFRIGGESVLSASTSGAVSAGRTQTGDGQHDVPNVQRDQSLRARPIEFLFRGNRSPFLWAKCVHTVVIRIALRWSSYRRTAPEILLLKVDSQARGPQP